MKEGIKSLAVKQRMTDSRTRCHPPPRNSSDIGNMILALLIELCQVSSSYRIKPLESLSQPSLSIYQRVSLSLYFTLCNSLWEYLTLCANHSRSVSL